MGGPGGGVGGFPKYRALYLPGPRPKKGSKNGQKWPKMTKNSQKWSKIAKNGQKCPKMTKNGQKCPKWLKMTKNGVSKGKIPHFWRNFKPEKI